MTADSTIPGYNSANWPNLQNPARPTAADHAAHTTRKGIHYPEDIGMVTKHGKKIFKVAKMHRAMPKRAMPKRRKKFP